MKRVEQWEGKWGICGQSRTTLMLFPPHALTLLHHKSFPGTAILQEIPCAPSSVVFMDCRGVTDSTVVSSWSSRESLFQHLKHLFSSFHCSVTGCFSQSFPHSLLLCRILPFLKYIFSILAEGLGHALRLVHLS